MLLDMISLVAKFESHADSVVAWVTRSKTDLDRWEIMLRDDRSGTLEIVSTSSLRVAIQQARNMVH